MYPAVCNSGPVNTGRHAVIEESYIIINLHAGEHCTPVPRIQSVLCSAFAPS
ncbi:hypothetical protein M404DRAFT_991305 [Pisolithus tinctorius Marx 270]|uniref:Uncharacterized protein n=1 Tax=Pisolithus tinctorius Marx 270 TaxID=870435 RepID=A0A0C3PY86_PISTI|nr:hypothetical protein M404DRAFT_991305 [Pisolithus tinctorius Marx 270]